MNSDNAHILVADDGRVIRTLISRKLEEHGFRVTVAAGGREALEQLAAESFDLVVLDVMMPDLDGMQTLKTLRESRSPGQLPVIMATANEESEDAVRAFELGANDFVTKPINFPVLLARIETQLRLKRATEELEREIARRTRAEADLRQVSQD